MKGLEEATEDWGNVVVPRDCPWDGGDGLPTENSEGTLAGENTWPGVWGIVAVEGAGGR